MVSVSNLPKRVTREQFRRHDAEPRHEPTRATFLRSGKLVMRYDWCLAGLVPGAVNDPAEIMDMAQTILTEKMDEVVRERRE